MKRKSRLPPIQVILRFYPGQDDDLIHWLRELDEEPTRTKTQALKEALRSGIGSEHVLSGAEGPLQATVAAPALDLVEVRRVVEAAITTALGRFEGQVVGAAATTLAEEDDEVEALLEGFQYSLVMGDD
jgi:hypothetical protein